MILKMITKSPFCQDFSFGNICKSRTIQPQHYISDNLWNIFKD